MKIPDAETAVGLKQFWAAALDRLRSAVEQVKCPEIGRFV
jgi:hypothetical protein